MSDGPADKLLAPSAAQRRTLPDNAPPDEAGTPSSDASAAKPGTRDSRNRLHAWSGNGNGRSGRSLWRTSEVRWD